MLDKGTYSVKFDVKDQVAVFGNSQREWGAPTITLTASPSDLPTGGGSVTLSWAAQEATGVLLSPFPGTIYPPIGTETVVLTADGTFVFEATAINPSPTVTTVTDTVKVWPIPKINTFSISPTGLPYGGGPAVLSWSVESQTVSQVTLDDEPVEPVGFKSVVVDHSDNFVLEASNPFGVAHAEAFAEVSTHKPHPHPPKGTFTSAPTGFHYGGGTAVLTWSAEEADYAEITPGWGAVNPSGGSITVPVTLTTTFNLHLENELGETDVPLTVPVATPIDISRYFIYDWRELGSGPGPDSTNHQLPSQLVTKGWWDFLFNPAWAGAKTFIDTFTTFGADALVVHRPFGQPVNPGMQMDWCAFQYAKQNPTLFRVVSANAFVASWAEFYKRTRKPIFFYLGYPRSDYGLLMGKTDDQQKALITEGASLIFSLKNTLKSLYPSDVNPVGIICDTLGDKDLSLPKNKLYKFAVDIVVANGIPKLHAEPWPGKTSQFIKDQDYNYFVIENDIKSLSPDKNPGAISWAAFEKDVDAKIVAVITGHGGPYTPEQIKQRTITNLNKEFAVAYQGWDTSVFTNAMAIKQQASISV